MTSRRPHQVAILIDSLTPGGAERIAVEAAGALDRNRFQPHLLVTRQGGGLAALAEDRDIPLTILDRGRGFTPRKLERAFAIVRASSIVHAHLWGSGMWGALFAKTARRPLIAHVHRFDAERSRLWLPGYRYWIAPAARFLVCVSEEIATALRLSGVPANVLRVVPNGVTVGEALSREAAREELGLTSRGAVIGMVARLREEKGHDLALNALAVLKGRGDDVVLCVVGDGPEEESLRRLTFDLGVSEAVIWAGPRENAGRLVRAFDVTLVASTIEGMPLAVLEALVEGVPVVSTPVGAIPALLADGGGIVAAAYPGELADALATTLAATDQACLTRSMERARETYGIDSVACELQHLYDAALALAAGRPSSGA